MTPSTVPRPGVAPYCLKLKLWIVVVPLALFTPRQSLETRLEGIAKRPVDSPVLVDRSTRPSVVVGLLYFVNGWFRSMQFATIWYCRLCPSMDKLTLRWGVFSFHSVGVVQHEKQRVPILQFPGSPHWTWIKAWLNNHCNSSVVSVY